MPCKKAPLALRQVVTGQSCRYCWGLCQSWPITAALYKPCLGLLWDFCVCGRQASYLLSVSFCSNASVWQVERQRLVGWFSLKCCMPYGAVSVQMLMGTKLVESPGSQVWCKFTFTSIPYINPPYYYWSKQSPEPYLSRFASEGNNWRNLRENLRLGDQDPKNALKS